MSATKKKNEVVAEEETPKEVESPEILDDELERLIPEPGKPIALEDGTEVFIRPLKLKELFAALKIITRGSAMSMGSLGFSMLQDSQDQFSETVIALLINAFPEADQEVCEFLRIVVDPVPPNDDGKWKDRAEQLEAEQKLDELLLENPDIGDAITVLSAVIYTESRDMQRLGKKIGNAVKMFSKVTPKTPQK